MHTKLLVELLPHQVTGVTALETAETQHHGMILADDMGLGKTLQAIAIIAKGLARDRTQRTLVVLPPSLIQQWVNEIATKTTISSDRVMVYKNGSTDIRSKIRIVFVSYRYAVIHLAALSRHHFHRVVLDEGHIIRNPKTQTFKAMLGLRYDIGHVLTGSPAINGIVDLVGLLEFIRAKVPLGKNPKKTLEKAPPEVTEAITKYIVRRTKSIMDLPPLTEITEVVKFSKKERAHYLGLVDAANVSFREWLMHANGSLVGGTYMEILVHLLRLRQACNHSSLQFSSKTIKGGLEECVMCGTQTTRGCKTHPVCKECIPSVPPECYFCKISPYESPKKVYSTKVKKLLEIIANHSSKASRKGAPEKVVIFSQWTSFLDIVECALNDHNIRFSRLDGGMSASAKNEAIDEFTKPKTRVFLASLMAGGVGLNLTMATVVVLCDLWWNDPIECQARDRVLRIGQTRPVTFYRLVVDHSIEEWMGTLKKKKSESINIGELSFGKHTRLANTDITGMFEFLRASKVRLVEVEDDSEKT